MQWPGTYKLWRSLYIIASTQPFINEKYWIVLSLMKCRSCWCLNEHVNFNYHIWKVLFWTLTFSASSRQFDLHMMLCLLKNITDASISNKFSIFDFSQSSDLSRIWTYKTKIMNTVNGQLACDGDFEQYWDDITGVWQIMKVVLYQILSIYWIIHIYDFGFIRIFLTYFVTKCHNIFFLSC